MAIKCTDIFHCKTLKILPNLGFLVRKYTIWQPCSAHEKTKALKGNRVDFFTSVRLSKQRLL
jgi:hypothetical protein